MTESHNNQKKKKKSKVVNDFSGFGRCSLQLRSDHLGN